MIEQLIREGRPVTIQNPATGSSVSDEALLRLVQPYVSEYLASATFQQFLSTFEDFIFALLRLWLSRYPHALSEKQVKFSTVIGATGREAIIGIVVEDKLDDLKRERLARWFEFLSTLVNLGCPTKEELGLLAEAKASRDLLVHNQGVANSIYREKSGQYARYPEGGRIELPEQYHRATWSLVKKVVQDVSDAAAAKARNS